MPWCFCSCPFCRLFISTLLLLYACGSQKSRSPHTKAPVPSLARRLSAGAPDVLEVAVTLSEAVDAVVGLAHGANEAAEGVGLSLASESAVLVDLGDADLNRAVVLGLDDAVGGAALAGDVTARSRYVSPCLSCLPLLCVSFCRSGGALCSVGGRKSRDDGGIVQVDKVSAFVLHGDGVVRWGVVEKKMGLKTTTFGGARTGEIRLRQSPRSFPQARSHFDAKPSFSRILWPVRRRAPWNIVFPVRSS